MSWFAEAPGWIAPLATMLAAMMTAANLGPRLTGWGFVVFLVGSLSWCLVAATTHQPNLLWSNGFLTCVNILGIWRWLGRQARYEKAGRAAVQQSARAPVATLASLQALIGAKLQDASGASVGVVVDGMMRCADAGLAYLVVSEGGVGGVGERLHAVGSEDLVFHESGVTSRLSAQMLSRYPVLADGQWPVAPGARSEPGRPAGTKRAVLPGPDAPAGGV